MKILVTGATGFLGGALCRTLAERGLGNGTLDVVGSGRDPEAGAALENLGIRFVPAELADRDAVADLCAGADAVVHSGALSAPWGAWKAFEAANVLGTENVLAACRQHGARRLVHISTPSIYADGKDQFDVAEDALLPRPVNLYALSKSLAEDAVRRAHDAGLPVVTLRPRALFGPGDRTILPRLVRLLEAKKLRVIGDGDNVVDLTYIDNAVDAILGALHAPESCLGKTYNITNGEPLKLWPLIAKLARELDLEPPRGRVPYAVAYALATGSELVHRLLRRPGEPRLTRYGVNVLARSMTLDISAARRDLGYRPTVSIDEGLRRFVTWWQENV